MARVRIGRDLGRAGADRKSRSPRPARARAAGRNGVDDLAYGATPEQVAAFLRAERRRDPGVLDRFADARKRARTDYRPRILRIFEDACGDFVEECAPEADFSKITGLARGFESRGSFAEAADVWRDLSEVVCDEIGFCLGCDKEYYSDVFCEAVSALASSSRRSPTDERRSNIAYLAERCLSGSPAKEPPRAGRWSGRFAYWPNVESLYMSALGKMCASEADLRYWLSLTGGRGAAKLLMRARVMRRLRDPSLGRFLAEHRERSPALYAEHVGHLRRSGASGARAARAGARLFPRSARLASMARKLGGPAREPSARGRRRAARKPR